MLIREHWLSSLVNYRHCNTSATSLWIGSVCEGSGFLRQSKDQNAGQCELWIYIYVHLWCDWWRVQHVTLPSPRDSCHRLRLWCTVCSIASGYRSGNMVTDWLLPDVSVEVTFSISVLIGQFDHVSYRGLMGSATIVQALYAHYCRSHFFRWGTLSVEIM